MRVRACLAPACVLAYVRTYVLARPDRERVKSVWLGTSEIWDRWLRTSAQTEIETGENAWQRSGAAIVTKKRFVSEMLFPCTCNYEGKFALEQPSGTGVGHELARAAFMHVLR